MPAFFGVLRLYDTPVMPLVAAAKINRSVGPTRPAAGNGAAPVATLNTIDISVSIFAGLDYSRPSLNDGVFKGLRRTPT